MEKLNTTTPESIIARAYSPKETCRTDENADRTRKRVDVAMASIPPRYRGLKFKNMDIKDPDSERAVRLAKRYLDKAGELLARGASGFACGGVGTGKTHISCILTENLARMGFSARYTTAWDMIQDIRSAYSDKSTSVQSMVKRYVSYDFLVIDEIGVQNGSNDERVLLFQVINGRYDNIKSTLIISNSSNPVEDGYLDGRTIDRLKEGGGFSLKLNGESYRR